LNSKKLAVVAPGAGSGGVEGQGILDSRILPDREFLALWNAIILEQEIKDRLLAQAILNFTLRTQVDREEVPLHGVILLVGVPGTGKTSLARGLAARTAEVLNSPDPFLYIEVEPHALASAALGKSQKAVTELLGSTIAEHAALKPLIVLLDEVETLAASRARMSLEANPIDVHRATDAVLAQLDQLAGRYPNLLFLATSNFPKAIDSAFLSRADSIVTIDLPGPEACRKILESTVLAMAKAFPQLKAIVSQPDFEKAAKLCQGFDGRRIRKLVVEACTSNREAALNPSLLTAKDLLYAVEHARQVAEATQGDEK
jgi:SpoVK/Ycf46/Vps4 family AAA+-type ATPase